MSLGPKSLNAAITLGVISNKAFSTAITNFNNGTIEWNDKSLSLAKVAIRESLRLQQEHRCIFCRRIIKIERRNAAEDIEHFLDKSKTHYKKWAFQDVNLALACHPCNMEKSTRDMGDNSIRFSTTYTSTSGNYTWLHPYFDDYHANIKIEQGWIYVIKSAAPQPGRAARLINDCRLTDVQKTERYRTNVFKRAIQLASWSGRALKKQNNQLASRLIQKLEAYLKEQEFNI